MLDKLLKVMKIVFYVVGIITFLAFLNFKGGEKNIKPNTTPTTITKEVTNVNKTVVEHNYITPNTIGFIIIVLFSIFVLSGVIYAIISAKKQKTKPNLKLSLK